MGLRRSWRVAGIATLSLAAAVASCGRTQFDELIDGVGGASGIGGSGTGGVGAHSGMGGIGTGGGVGVGGHVGTGGRIGTGGRGFGGTGVGGAGIGGRIGGAGGAGPPRCVPGSSQSCACTNGASGAQVCGATGTFGACVCDSDFLRIRFGMVGNWFGVDSSPWVGAFKVFISFGANGVYTGHCAGGMCPAPVFYYGVDDDSPVKTYELRSLNADGTAGGFIQIIFAPTDTTGGNGSLEAVTLSADGQRLQFEFWATWNGRYGPVKFDLTRLP